MKHTLFLIAFFLLGLSAILAFAQPNPNPSDCASFIENDSTFIMAGDYLPAMENLHAMEIPSWQMTVETFSPSKKYAGFLFIPRRLEKFQVVAQKTGGGYFWAELGVFINYNSDGTPPAEPQRYKKLGVYGDGKDFYFQPVDRGWVDPKPPVEPPNIHIPNLGVMNDYESFTDGVKTYFRRESLKGFAPFFVMDAKTWQRLGTALTESPYPGFWEYPGVVDSCQIVSVTNYGPPERYEWADPGAKGGNWVGANELDHDHPYARFGVRIDPSPAGHSYLFVPVRVPDQTLAAWLHGGTSAVASATTSAPTEFTLQQNYPNPFNPATTISYELPRTSEVKITIYDAVGRVTKTLVSGTESAGSHQVVWDGRDESDLTVPSGLYFYHINADGFTATKRMMLVK